MSIKITVILGLSTDLDELVDFKQYKEQYHRRVNQYINSQGIWTNESNSTTKNSKPEVLYNPDCYQDYLTILNENDSLKREIYQIEVENKDLQSKSKSNKEIIDELQKKLHKLIQNKQACLQNLQFENDIKISQGQTQEGLLTKRSSALTDRENVYYKVRREINSKNNFNDSENSTVKEVSFERWAKKYNIYDASVLSIKTDKIFKNCSSGGHNSVEHLIDELKEEYKLSEQETTQIKFGMSMSHFTTKNTASSICFNAANKDIIRSNLRLSLNDKKISTLMKNNSICQSKQNINNGSSMWGYSQASRFERSIESRKQRLNLSLMSNLFGKLIM